MRTSSSKSVLMGMGAAEDSASCLRRAVGAGILGLGSVVGGRWILSLGKNVGEAEEKRSALCGWNNPVIECRTAVLGILAGL